MEFYYLNSKNEKLDFMNFPYLARDISELLNYGHSYKYNGNKISGFYDTVSEIPFSINVYADSKEEYKSAANRFFEVTEYDVVNNKKGKLYYNGQYVECNLISNKKSDWFEQIGLHVANVNMVTDFPYWIHEMSKQFMPAIVPGIQDGLDFQFDYPFEFANNGPGTEKWFVDHYMPCDFEMTIYGPCIEPKIYVNRYPYQIHTILEEGEYLTIDSRRNSVIKYKRNGEIENIYNSRDFSYSVFKKMPCGLMYFDWNGMFGFDLTVFLERSEPKW